MKRPELCDQKAILDSRVNNRALLDLDFNAFPIFWDHEITDSFLSKRIAEICDMKCYSRALRSIQSELNESVRLSENVPIRKVWNKPCLSCCFGRIGHVVRWFRRTPGFPSEGYGY
jgi:hypothetical protein